MCGNLGKPRETYGNCVETVKRTPGPSMEHLWKPKEITLNTCGTSMETDRKSLETCAKQGNTYAHFDV